MHLRDLLARGWFPRELPPPFVTRQFADAVCDADGELPWDVAGKDALQATHSLPRYEGLRRNVELVNPTAQYGLSKEIATNWDELSRATGRSIYSSSRPCSQPSGRAIEREHARIELPARRALNRTGSRWILRADISRHYPSFYTHSIPWALHTKETAKRTRGDSLLGNRLDTWVRKGQSGQTKGIPIGPDTSLVLSELVLSAVDVELGRRVPKPNFLRYMDDYEFATGSEADANAQRLVLEELLSEYDLALNTEKTGALALPRELQRPWTGAIRRSQLRLRTRHEVQDIIGYFDLAFSLANAHRGEPVLNFALAHLREAGRPAREEARELLEAMMLQAMAVESGTQRYVIAHLTEDVDENVTSRARLSALFSEHIRHHVPNRRANEVAWALWAAIAMELDLDAGVAAAVSVLEDDIVALLALDARERGVLQGLDVSQWSSYMKADQLMGSHWLLAYEANVKGWLSGKKDYVADDEKFGWIKARDVSFYDSEITFEASLGMLEPEAAWEDSYSG